MTSCWQVKLFFLFLVSVCVDLQRNPLVALPKYWRRRLRKFYPHQGGNVLVCSAEFIIHEIK